MNLRQSETNRVLLHLRMLEVEALSKDEETKKKSNLDYRLVQSPIRKNWKAGKIKGANRALLEMNKVAHHMDHLYAVTEFPALKKDGYSKKERYDEQRVSQYLLSHKGLNYAVHQDLINKEVSARVESPSDSDVPEVGVASDSEKEREIVEDYSSDGQGKYDAEQPARQKYGAEYREQFEARKLVVPDSDSDYESAIESEDEEEEVRKLPGDKFLEFLPKDQREEFKSRRKKELASGYYAQVAMVLGTIDKPSFMVKPNCYQLALDLLSKATAKGLGLNSVEESKRLLAEIKMKDDMKALSQKKALEKGILIKKGGEALFSKKEQVSIGLESWKKVDAKSKASRKEKSAKRLSPDKRVHKSLHKDLAVTQKAIGKKSLEQEYLVNKKRKEIINFINRLPEDPEERSAEELRRLEGKAVLIDIERAFKCYAKGDFDEIKKKNPNLKNEDIQPLISLITEHHKEATKLQCLNTQVKNMETAVRLQEKFARVARTKSCKEEVGELNRLTTDLIQAFNSEKLEGKAKKDAIKEKEKAITQFLDVFKEELWKSKVYESLNFMDDIRDYTAAIKGFYNTGNTHRHYELNASNPHSHMMAALSYEYTLGIVFREHQIKEFSDRVGTADMVTWLGTGFGKTFMAPSLAKMMANGRNLMCVLDTKDLIPTTHKTRDRDSREVYGQAAYHFKFSRGNDRSVKSLQEIKYRFLKCVDEEGYMVTSKQALGSLALQLLTWQRYETKFKDGKYLEQIELTQDILNLLKTRGVALADEIHIILDVVDALDYSEGDKASMKDHSEYYETTSTIYRAMYPDVSDKNENEKSLAEAKEIAESLGISKNKQAQVNAVTVKENMFKLANRIVRQSMEPDSQFKKDPLHKVIQSIIESNRDKGLDENVFVQCLMNEEKDGENLNNQHVNAWNKMIEDLPKEDKKYIGALKENLSSTFGKVLKKIADEDFGLSTDGLSICPYDKGRAQPEKEFDDIFQTIQTHYMWYKVNGIPVEGLKKKIAKWKGELKAELKDWEDETKCPAYKKYKRIFGGTSPDSLSALSDDDIESLATNSKSYVVNCFLEKEVLPNLPLYPKKVGFTSMDLVSMFDKFGGYSGTIQTRSTFHSGVSNKGDLEVDKAAQKNFKEIYENPKNQEQFVLKDLESDEMQAFINRDEGIRAVPISKQIEHGGIDITDYRAIIDLGGQFKENRDIEMAQDLLEEFEKKGTLLEAVLVYNDKSELMILRKGSKELEPFDSKTVPPEYNNRFTIYRQPQITGADIPQDLHAKALVTMSEKTSWGDFEQAVGRLRKNKEGQTYSVIYRESLLKKIQSDVDIAKRKKAEAEVKKLEGFLSQKGGKVKINVRELTQDIEKEEIKQKRYFAAVGEMENIVRQALMGCLCEKGWEEVVKLEGFEDFLFPDSLKSPEKLLEIKTLVPTLEALKDFKASLVALLDKAKKAATVAKEGTGGFGVLEVLGEAISDLEAYEKEKFPKVEDMPEKVIGGAKSDRTVQKEVEVEKETELDKENLSEQEVEVERTQLEEIARSSMNHILNLEWRDWSPTQLFDFDYKILNFSSLASDSVQLLSHLKYRKRKREEEYDCLTAFDKELIKLSQPIGEGVVRVTIKNLIKQNFGEEPDPKKCSIEELQSYNSKKKEFEQECKQYINSLKSINGPLSKESSERLFNGIYVSNNYIQRSGFFPAAILSRGQKTARSIAELSHIDSSGKRVFRNMLLDMRDHACFEKHLLGIKLIMTDDFMSSVQKTVEEDEKLASETLENLKNNQNEYFYGLFEGENAKEKQEKMHTLISFLGSDVTLKDLTSISIRVNVEGHYTAACGVLGIGDETDEEIEINNEALKVIVRSKVINGNVNYNKRERKVLEEVIRKDFLQMDLLKEYASDDASVEKVEKEVLNLDDEGIKDLKKQIETAKKELVSLSVLYQRAVDVRRPEDTVNMKDQNFGWSIDVIKAKVTQVEEFLKGKEEENEKG